MNMVPTGSGSGSATLSKTIQNTKQVRHFNFNFREGGREKLEKEYIDPLLYGT
jgi:hypothetical protein